MPKTIIYYKDYHIYAYYAFQNNRDCLQNLIIEQNMYDCNFVFILLHIYLSLSIAFVDTGLLADFH